MPCFITTDKNIQYFGNEKRILQKIYVLQRICQHFFIKKAQKIFIVDNLYYICN